MISFSHYCRVRISDILYSGVLFVLPLTKFQFSAPCGVLHVYQGIKSSWDNHMLCKSLLE